MKDANHWSHLFKYIITSALVAASKYALSKEIKLRNKEMSYSFFKIWEVQRQVRENKPNSNRGSSRGVEVVKWGSIRVSHRRVCVLSCSVVSDAL